MAMKLPQNVKPKKERTRKSIILRFCVFTFVIYSTIMLLDMQVTLANRRQEAAILTEKLEIQRIANKELERQKRMGVDHEYIERVARDQLGYVYPDWRVYIDTSGS